MKRISKENELLIIEMYKSGSTMKQVGQKFQITATTVLRILNRYNVPKRTKGGKEPIDPNLVIKMYKQGKTCQSIAEQFNLTCHSITNLLEKNGVKRDNIYHNRNLIEDYWEKIDRYDKAYFLGMMITDGCVIENSVSIGLKESDKYIIEKFAQNTHNENKLYFDKRKGKNTVSLGVKRKKWVDDLAKYGVVNKKTSICYLPILENEEMMSHLIRGMIDGDGWISYKNKAIGFCGNEKCVTQLRDFLVKKLDVYNVKIVRGGEHLWQVSWASKKDVKKIGEYIYTDKNDCYLKRKFENFCKIIQVNTEVSHQIAQG